MRKSITLFSGLLLFLLLFPSSVLAQATTFTVEAPSESLFDGKFMGYGAEVDPFFWDTPNTNPDVIGNPQHITGVNDADWQIITQRIKDMHIPVVRMMMQLGWATRDPDLNTWNWNSPIMQSVFRYLDFACVNNIDVVLNDWAWTARGWSQSAVSLYQDETDPRYAQGIAKYLKEFIDNRGYKCIKYLVVSNEPDGELIYLTNRTYSEGLRIYETMINNVNTALINNGMRAKIKFMGPDMGGFWNFFQDSVNDLHTIFDVYDYHRYPPPTCSSPDPPCSSEITNIGISDPYASLSRMLEERRKDVLNLDPNGASKQMLVTEMGIASGMTLTSGQNDTFEYALEMADYATTLLSTRNHGGIIWNLFDLIYSVDQNIYWTPPFYDENFFQWGLWKYKDNNWALRPVAQAWGLFTRFAPPGSIQSRINGFPSATADLNLPPLSPYRVGALVRPDGGWSIFLINETAINQPLTVQLPGLPVHNFSLYRLDRTTLASYPNRVAIPPVGTVLASKNITVVMPPQTFVVLVEDTPVLTPAPSCKPGDVNCDGTINITDLLTVIGNYGKSGGAGDLNNDNKVNMMDAVVVIKNWGV